MSKTYVVTGGAGFIGSHIATRLLQEGHRVRVVDNFITGKTKNIDYLESLGGDFEFHEVSITNVDALAPIFVGVDTVFHQAALASVPRSIENPLETHANTATGTLNILHTAHQANVRRVVYAASSSAYGDVEDDMQHETMLPDPISPYGVAKLMGEYYCRVFHHVYGLETVALRYFNVFGARQDPTSQYAAVIPKFITMMMNGDAPTIFGDGEQTRDFIYIDNVVHGNLLASESTAAVGKVMNLATGGQVSVNDLIRKINALLESDIVAQYTEPRAGDILHSRADIQKARDLLDFAPIVAFDKGLARTVTWYKTHWQG